MRPAIRALYPRIHRVPIEKAEGEFPTEVEVRLADGRAFETAVPWPAGSLARPFTQGELWAKFEGCTAGLLAAPRAAALRDALERLAGLATIEPLMAPLYDTLP